MFRALSYWVGNFRVSCSSGFVKVSLDLHSTCRCGIRSNILLFTVATPTFSGDRSLPTDNAVQRYGTRND